MKLLITGIPGTGKTTVGDYLAEAHAFRHLDLEPPSVDVVALDGPVEGFQARIGALAGDARRIVVTWGVPVRFLPFVLQLRNAGFEWFWFDGDRTAARRTFKERGTVPEEALDIQLGEIDKHLNMDALRLRFLNTFASDGSFRPLDEIAAELLGESAHPGAA